MKKFIVSITVFLLIGCSSQDDSAENQSIIGTWKLVEFYGGDGTQANWTPEDDGYTYTFREDNVLISDRYPCDEGTYELEGNQVEVYFDCSGSIINFIYEFEFINGYLIFTSGCNEVCKEKFERVP